MPLHRSSAIPPTASGLPGADTPPAVPHADPSVSATLPIPAAPASRPLSDAARDRTASIRLLPGDVLAQVVALLDAPSRRALGGADRHARSLLTPLRRFDRLHAQIRWSDSIARLAELLGSVSGEPAPQRGTLLCSVVERIVRLGSVSQSLSVRLIEEIERLPAAEKARPLAALAAVLGRQHPRDHELERRMLVLAEPLPPGTRGQIMGQCLMSFCPATTQAGLQHWLAMADGLPPEGASRLLTAIVHVAARREQLSEALVASVLERVRGLRTATECRHLARHRY